MSSPVEHPDDITARLRIRDALRTHRHELRLTTAAVSRLAGLHEYAVRDMERRPTWELWRAQQWARGLGHQLRLCPQGLTIPEPDTTALVLEATVAFGAYDEDQLHLRTVIHDLARTRRHQGITAAGLARTCGTDERAVSNFEADPTRSLLRIWQRYVRALGGHLTFELVPVEVGVPA